MRRLAIVATLGLLLAGCDVQEPEPVGTPAPVIGEAREVTDSLGTDVMVPAAPSRVATTSVDATEALFDLGVTPVAQGSFTPDDVPEALYRAIKDVPVIANFEGEVNRQKLADARPDLILAPKTSEDEVVERLRTIAPVFLVNDRIDNPKNWGVRTRQAAHALNLTGQWDRLEADFEARREELMRDYKGVTAGTSVAAISSYEANSATLWGSEAMAATLLVSLGFTWSKKVDALASASGLSLSEDTFGETIDDADVLFYATDLRGQTNAPTARLMGGSAYREVPAVKNGRDFPLGKVTFDGYADANYALDRIEDALKKLGA